MEAHITRSENILTASIIVPDNQSRNITIDKYQWYLRDSIATGDSSNDTLVNNNNNSDIFVITEEIKEKYVYVKIDYKLDGSSSPVTIESKIIYVAGMSTTSLSRDMNEIAHNFKVLASELTKSNQEIHNNLRTNYLSENFKPPVVENNIPVYSPYFYKFDIGDHSQFLPKLALTMNSYLVPSSINIDYKPPDNDNLNIQMSFDTQGLGYLDQLKASYHTSTPKTEDTASTGNTATTSDQTTNQTGSTTNNSTDVTLSAENTAIQTGQTVTGSGIPDGTTVTAISGTTLTLSQSATLTNSTNLIFTLL